ncbi:hypothetical protein AbraIFM66950_000935 [Aspergillus brasiliensis]|nr:hypothetical protein AbraIFM66950_000935 [Aspergillus brasiliensis]
MAPELILAVIAVGSHYCLESHQGLNLFAVAKSIALDQVRHRDAANEAESHDSPDSSWTLTESPKYQPESTPQGQGNHHTGDSSQYRSFVAETETMQAVFLLMAMATWGGEHRSLVRQAIALQSMLAMLVRQHGLSEQLTRPATWQEWARIESGRRTKLIIFCFFNLHTIAFNLPSPLWVADIQLHLPCTEREWRCPDAASWAKMNRKVAPPPLFQDCVKCLLREDGKTPGFSSLGGHVLIHALLQRIISFQRSIPMESMERQILPGFQHSLRQALGKWQSAWEKNPDSSYSPLDKHGPIASNSRALYHLAHVRLALDIGPVRSLLEQTPDQLVRKLEDGPKMERGPQLLVAAKHATAALCSPVQMGIHFVGRAPSWSVTHAVCSLEYAYILNQYIQRVIHIPRQDLEADERTLLETIKEILCEVEASSSTGDPEIIEREPKVLGLKTVRAWAMILDGMHTWNVVHLITKTLYLFADSLECSAFGNDPQ